MKGGDDGLNCNQYQTQLQSLGPSVFGFVGSWSDFDNCGLAYFQANPTIPDVHYLLSSQSYSEPGGFTPQPQPPGFRTGPFQYYAQKYPDAVKKVGAALDVLVADDLRQPEGGHGVGRVTSSSTTGPPSRRRRTSPLTSCG